ncbi:hypothetical protein DVG78_16345 [Runella aurantiaca]|uniref:Uncharacterized protein n=1 Tax=Runella aurantiaca TaxID=2282308 RepID=A0A369I705_9BACT|nr:hypothetical protein DVG78_16345 [Runella aurantiaca]
MKFTNKIYFYGGYGEKKQIVTAIKTNNVSSSIARLYRAICKPKGYFNLLFSSTIHHTFPICAI